MRSGCRVTPYVSLDLGDLGAAQIIIIIIATCLLVVSAQLGCGWGNKHECEILGW